VRPATVSVPDLEPPAFPAALKATVPLPLPFAGEVMVSQLALLVELHPQPLAAVTLTLPVPPAAGTFSLVDDSAYVQPVPWLTVNVWPAAVMAPLRAGPLFAATVNRTVPSPVTFAGEVIVIQDTALAALHAQPAAVCTVKEPCPPASSNLVAVDESVYAHP
jgi:hypothetical protein